MREVNIIFNKILYASNRRLRKIELKCNPKGLLYLEALSSINVIEFYKDAHREHTYVVIISYYFGKPVLNNISRVGKRNTGGVSLRNWSRIQNSRKSIFIATTNSGIKVLDLVTNKDQPLSLLYKIELN